MQINKSWLAAALLTVYISPVSAPAKTAPASEELKAETKNISITLPEPAVNELENAKASVHSRARADWFSAIQLYHDNVFKPQPQRRVDVAGSPIVILQGFHWYADNYWYHPPNGWWGVLAQNAGEVGRSGFDLIWFPPASNGSYYPNEWYNLDSQWGTKAALIQAVGAMHAAGVKVVADIVLNHRNGTNNWLDFTSPDWPSTVVVRDDEVWAQSAYSGMPRSLNYDEGQGEYGARDLDHRNAQIQQDTKIFMRWMKNAIGFDGWRYDMVKGFLPYHVAEYNEASSPIFSVGEYLDGSSQLITDWIDGTDNSSGR